MFVYSSIPTAQQTARKTKPQQGLQVPPWMSAEMPPALVLEMGWKAGTVQLTDRIL